MELGDDSVFLHEVESVQFEISTKCNSMCPACIRVERKDISQVNRMIPRNREMPLQIFDNALDSKVASSFKKIEFCGTLDEPLMHSQFLEMLDLIYEKIPSCSVQIHTNGGIRNSSFFEDLAKSISRFPGLSVVKFSIDGLADTNSIYRYGVNYSRVISNLESFIQAGGKAVWQTLEFPWNRHQIADMKSLAQDMGCTEFWVRPDRSPISLLTPQQLEACRNPADEASRQIVQNIYKPKKKSAVTASEPTQNLEGAVHCSYRSPKKMIFVSWDGKVWPCCFWPNSRYESDSEFPQKIENAYGENFNSLETQTLSQILDHPLFQRDLVESWRTGSWQKSRCLQKCSKSRRRISDGKIDDKTHIQHIPLRTS